MTITLRPFGALLLTLSLVACGSPIAAEATPATPVLGIDLGGAPGSAPTPANALGDHSGHQPQPRRGIVMAHAGHAQAQGTGTVKAINAEAHSITLSHGPIAALGWPAMTMDFAVAPSIDLQAIAPGARINFTIEHGEGDRYIIQRITPVGGGR